MVMVIVTLAIVLAVGAGLLFHSRSFRDVTNLQVDTERAYSLARSGIGAGDKHLFDSPCSSLSSQIYDIGDGTLNLTVDSQLTFVSGEYISSGNITSIGEVGRSAHTLRKEFSNSINGWSKTSGIAGVGDGLSELKITSGGYLLAGSSGSDILLLKTNVNGDIGAEFPDTWATTYDGGYGDNLSSFVEIGDVFVLGGNSSDGLNQYFFLGQTLSDRSIDWAWKYGSTNGSNLAKSMVLCNFGGYILGGDTYGFTSPGGDILVVKTSDSGAVEWANKYGGKDTQDKHDRLNAMQNSLDNGYIFAGGTGNFPSDDVGGLVIKTLSGTNGEVDWARKYGDSGGFGDEFSVLQKISDGYILGGTTHGFDGMGSYFVVKILANGDTDWAWKYGGIGAELFFAIQEVPDGGYIFGGIAPGSFGIMFDFVVIRIDSDGVPIWAKAYDYQFWDFFSSLQVTSDRGFLLGGTTMPQAGTNDLLVFRTDSSGDLDCCNYIEIDINNPSIFNAARVDNHARYKDDAFTLHGEFLVEDVKDVYPAQWKEEGVGGDITSSEKIDNISLNLVCPSTE